MSPGLIGLRGIPCVREMIDSTVKKSFGQYVKLPQEEEIKDWQPRGYTMMLYVPMVMYELKV